jgi:hypothetical protein
MVQDAEDEPTEQQPKAIRSRVALQSLAWHLYSWLFFLFLFF